MRKITIGIVLFPGFQMLDIAGPGDAFGEVKILSGGDHCYEFLTIGTTRGPIQSSSGLTMSPDRTIFDLARSSIPLYFREDWAYSIFWRTRR